MEVFAGPLWVHYGAAYIFVGDPESSDLKACFRGQANGLCGTASSGVMSLVTGLHTGQVGLTVEVSDAPPEVDSSWEEIVEAPFLVSDLPVALYEWGEASGQPLSLPQGQYRARYSARNMQAGSDQDTSADDETIIDEYRLQLWPAPASPDQVIRQTSSIAANWHNYARSLPMADA